jgi:hypothetical protein
MFKGRPKIPISHEDLLKHLDEQLRFLESSAASFDQGFEGEAKRLAATLRILLYDSTHSTSLLGQLKMKSRSFIDSSVKFDPSNVLEHGGLISIAMGPSAKYIAMLDDTPEKIREVNFEEWWNNPIFVDKEKRQLSRSQLILITTDQDGGAHVDPKLDESYSNFSKKGGLGWFVTNGKGKRPMEVPERAAIRQIAHEILKSLIPGYSKKPSIDASVIVGSVSITPGPPKNLKIPPPIKRVEKIGRNQPCPCGSGAKFKKCCGK